MAAPDIFTFQVLISQDVFQPAQPKKEENGQSVCELGRGGTVPVPTRTLRVLGKAPELESAKGRRIRNQPAWQGSQGRAFPNTFLNCFDKCSFVLNMYARS